jgi:aminopeptidase N
LFFENVYPDLVNGWWDFRVRRFKPQGWVNSTIYEASNFRGYVNAVYLQGTNYLDALRNKTGNENFLVGLKNYSLSNQHQIVSAQQFWQAFGDATFSEINDVYLYP